MVGYYNCELPARYGDSRTMNVCLGEDGVPAQPQPYELRKPSVVSPMSGVRLTRVRGEHCHQRTHEAAGAPLVLRPGARWSLIIVGRWSMQS
jgi:hypothetical protein